MRCHASTKRPVSSFRGKKTRNRSIVIGRVVQPTKRQMKKTRVEALILVMSSAVLCAERFQSPRRQAVLSRKANVFRIARSSKRDTLLPTYLGHHAPLS